MLVVRHQATFAPLVAEFNEENLVSILQSLLQNRIFESEVHAKAEFPWLFEAPKERGLEREESEADAARSMQDALENTDSDDEGEAKEFDAANKEEVPDQVQHPVPQKTIVGGGQAALSMPSLYPCFLPLQAQHIALSTIQRTLEESCFDFANQWLPEVLEAEGWDCSAAVELTKWAKVFARHSEKIPSNSAETRAASLKKLLIKNHNTRHIAVHRLPTSAQAMSQLLENAIELTVALDDHRRAAQLETLKTELDSKIRAMELNKTMLENTTAEGLQEICHQREELDRQEKALITGMVSDDLKNKKLVGSLQEQSVASIFASNGEPARLTGTAEEGDDDDDDSGSDDSDGDRAEDSVSVG